MQRFRLPLRLYRYMKEKIEHLIKECRWGSRTAQIALYKRFAPRLYATILRIVGNAAEAEEAMQDTFLKVFTRLDLYQKTECFEAWMHRIAIHTAIDYVRRNGPQWDEVPENYPYSDDNGPDEDAVQYKVEQIKKAVGELPAGYRIILSLYLFEGYDAEEIASILNLRPSSVRSQYLRGKRNLLEIIAKKKKHG